MGFRSDKGLTLLEVLLSITILSIILISFMNIFPQMGMMNKQNGDKQQAVNVANELLIDWQDNSVYDYKGFLAIPPTATISEYDRYEDPYYIFKTASHGFNAEIWLHKTSDLTNGSIEAHIIIVKILNNKNNVIAETYGYSFF